MKHHHLFVLLILCVNLNCFAQETDSIASEEKEKSQFFEILNNTGIYFLLAQEISPVRTQYQRHTRIEIGGSYKKWNFGGFKTVYEGEQYLPVIFPRNFSFDYLHGGGYLGYQALQFGWISCIPLVNLSFGDLIWKDEKTNEAFFRDRVFILHPQIEIDVSPLRYVKLVLKSGYRWIGALDLQGIKRKDIDGFTFTIGLKAGLIYENH